MHWECNELLASELQPYGDSFVRTWFKCESPFNLLSQARADEDLRGSQVPADAAEMAFQAWVSIVRAFSKGELTVPTDKLVAISAIAREMKPVMRCPYLAGLWETRLVRQLCWYVPIKGSRPPVYRAPSWSWASVDGEVNPNYNFHINPDPQYHPLVEVLETHVELATQDEMGQLTGGYIRLRGRLLEIEVKETLRILVNGEEIRAFLYRDDRDHPLKEATVSLWCLPISLEVVNKRKLNVPAQSIGLVLEKVDHLDAFRRVGVLQRFGGSENAPQPRLDPVIQFMGFFTLNDDGTETFIPNTSGMQEITII